MRGMIGWECGGKEAIVYRCTGRSLEGAQGVTGRLAYWESLWMAEATIPVDMAYGEDTHK